MFCQSYSEWKFSDPERFTGQNWRKEKQTLGDLNLLVVLDVTHDKERGNRGSGRGKTDKIVPVWTEEWN